MNTLITTSILPTPQRSHKTVPAPNAVLTFQCTLCNKGYSRQTDYDTHLSSYDHSHRQRLADMKKMTADPRASKASKASKNDEMRTVSIKLGGEGGKRKGGGFTKIQDLNKAKDAPEKDAETEKPRDENLKGFTRIGGNKAAEEKKAVEEKEGDSDMDSNYSDECGYEQYDPFRPTPCDESCPCGKGFTIQPGVPFYEENKKI